MYAKIEVTGVVELLSGMHIGGSTSFAAIGAVDSPIIRDPKTNLSMIPGSSLKGKMRSLLARQYQDPDATPNEPNEDPLRILRLFGSSKKGGMMRSRLIFPDLFLCNAKDLERKGVAITEVKFENSISRMTAVANPRQIERAVRGSEYDLHLIYNVDQMEDLEEDFETLRLGLDLLQYDYLGGHGSRGYGRVRFRDMDLECVIGEVDEAKLENCRNLLKGV